MQLFRDPWDALNGAPSDPTERNILERQIDTAREQLIAFLDRDHEDATRRMRPAFATALALDYAI